MIITNAHLAYNIYSYGIRNGGKIYTSRRAIILYDNIYYVISSQWAYALTYWSAYNRQSDTMVANKIVSCSSNGYSINIKLAMWRSRDTNINTYKHMSHCIYIVIRNTVCRLDKYGGECTLSMCASIR